MIKLMSVKDLQMKIREGGEGAKATAVLRMQKAAEEQALLDHLAPTIGASDDVHMGEKALAIINGAVDRGISGCDLRGLAKPNEPRRECYRSLKVGSVQPPHTQGKVQSAVRLALSGMYLLQASALTGLIDRQMTSNVPEASTLPIMTGLDRW